jgi:hypothetical protein
MVTMAESSALDRGEWTARLDQLTKNHEGERVSIELLDPTYGDLNEAERLPFGYVNYDPKDDVVIVAVGGDSPQYPVVLRHIISHPTELSMDEDETARGAVRVVDADGTVTLVSFFPTSAQRGRPKEIHDERH